MVAMDFFAALNSYDFFNRYCSNLLKNPTVRGLREVPILLGSVSERLERCFFPIHEPKFRSHSHRNCLMIVGYFSGKYF